LLILALAQNSKVGGNLPKWCGRKNPGDQRRQKHFPSTGQLLVAYFSIGNSMFGSFGMPQSG
jgi:hypothetical protein